MQTIANHTEKKTFKVGQVYSCSHPYGGWYRIQITRRTDDTITFFYMDDEKKKEMTRMIEIQEDSSDGIISQVETIKAWKYLSRYAPAGEYDYGYFIAID